MGNSQGTVFLRKLHSDNSVLAPSFNMGKKKVFGQKPKKICQSCQRDRKTCTGINGMHFAFVCLLVCFVLFLFVNLFFG